MLFPTESEVLAYLDKKNISDLEDGDYFQMDDGQWCLYRTDVYCNCEGCSENFMQNDEDNKGGYCGECYMCADCGCKCDEEEEEDEEETGESFTRTCFECDDDFTPSVEHAKDRVCDECVSEKGKKQILMA
ncbi:MAG: hypothetical protein ACOYNN_08705 [Terrimicrobiaceae bacterium]